MAEPIGLACVNHVSLAVADLERSVDFYVALTGVEPAAEHDQRVAGEGFERVSGAEGLSMRFATLHLENLDLNLIEFSGPGSTPAARPKQSPGSMHLGFQTRDIDEAVSRMRSAGFEFVADPYTAPRHEADEATAGMRFAYFDDPDGNHLELIAAREDG